MNTRRQYQVACPVCCARIGRPCHGKQGETLHGVHFQRTTALRVAAIAAFKSLYSPLPPRPTAHGHKLEGLLIALFLLLVAAPSLRAQQPRQTKVPVVFTCKCDDETGVLFAMAMRDALAASPRYVETTETIATAKARTKGAPVWTISVVSVDPSLTGKGLQSAISAIYLFNGTSLYQEIRICGRYLVDECAQGTLARFDTEHEGVVSDTPVLAGR